MCFLMCGTQWHSLVGMVGFLIPDSAWCYWSEDKEGKGPPNRKPDLLLGSSSCTVSPAGTWGIGPPGTAPLREAGLGSSFSGQKSDAPCLQRQVLPGLLLQPQRLDSCPLEMDW